MPDTATVNETCAAPTSAVTPVGTAPVAAPVPPPLPLAESVDNGMDLPQLRLEGLRTVRIPLTNPGLESLVGQPVNDHTIQMAMTYVNQAFGEYCAANNVRPANILGHASHVNQHVVEHVCHDQTMDGFHVNNRTRRYDIGRNGWVTDYSFDHTTNQLNVTLNLADISYVARPGDVTNIREHWVPANPVNVEIFDIRCTNGIMELTDGDDWIESSELNTWPGNKDRRRIRYRNNLRIRVKSRALSLGGFSEPEQRSLETLREMMSESDFRKYLKYGFVMVPGKSGRMYQVFRSRSHTKVWDSGVVIEEVCVRLQDSAVPLTDNVIAFMTMIQADEESFKQIGNVYKMHRQAA